MGHMKRIRQGIRSTTKLKKTLRNKKNRVGIYVIDTEDLKKELKNQIVVEDTRLRLQQVTNIFILCMIRTVTTSSRWRCPNEKQMKSFDAIPSRMRNCNKPVSQHNYSV